jgi:hypothetical protein
VYSARDKNAALGNHSSSKNKNTALERGCVGGKKTRVSESQYVYTLQKQVT